MIRQIGIRFLVMSVALPFALIEHGNIISVAVIRNIEALCMLGMKNFMLNYRWFFFFGVWLRRKNIEIAFENCVSQNS